MISVVDYDPEISGALLADLVIGVAIVESHVLYHCHIVKRKSRLRDLLRLAELLAAEAVEVGADPDSLARQASLKISALECH
jgi:hypothetical protein